MKASIFFILLFLQIINKTRLFAQQSNTFENEKHKCVYQLKNGVIDGKYQSFYKNGVKRCEGIISQNYRSGLWSVWDSAGRLKMQRNYSNPFSYQRLFPPVSKHGPIPLLSQPLYHLKHTEQGYIKKFRLRERAVVYANLRYREIPIKGNEHLFDTVTWKKIIYDFKAGKITAYQPYLIRNYNLDTLKPERFDTSQLKHIKMIGFKIREEMVFDKDRLLAEYHIIDILPIWKRKDSLAKGDFWAEKLWFSFNDLRRYFAHAQLPARLQTPLVKTIDDAFFFRHFYGFAYMEPEISGGYTRNSSDAEEGFNSIELDIELIEAENDLWIEFAG